jgi:putative ABC transport system ATP-binding protein
MSSPHTHHETSPAEAARAAVVRLFQLLRIERQALYVVTVYSVGIGLASLAAPIGVQMLVSAIAFGGLVQPIVILSLLVLVALTVAALLRATQAWVIERLQQRLFVRVAADLAQRLPQVEVCTFDETHGPELVNRFFDVLTLQKGAAMLLLDGVLVALQVVVGGLLLALYHPALLGFAIAVLLVALAVIVGMGRHGSSTSIKESKAKYALVAWFEEMARHPTIFRDHVGAGFAIQKSHELTRDYVSYRSAHFKVVFRQTVAFLALQAAATAALLGIGGTLVLTGQLTLGQLVAAELILTGVVAGFAKFGKYLESFYDLIAAMDKLGHLVDLPLEQTSTGRLPPVKGPLRLRIVDAEYKYPDGTGELAKVSLDVPAGARVAVVGPNGSGKSTLIDLIYGLREPTRGHIEIQGLPLRDLALGDVREHVALVRGAAIFEGTMLDNVCMGRPNITLEDVRRALELVGLWTEVTNLPEGLSTHISTNGGNLSTGQAQRLAIARAIVVKPSCLLLDEALDQLDPASRRFILEQILGERAPWTVIVATHDPGVAERCTHSFALDQAKLRPVTRAEDSQ